MSEPKICEVCGSKEWENNSNSMDRIDFCLNCKLTEAQYFRKDGRPFGYPETWELLGVAWRGSAPVSPTRDDFAKCFYYFRKVDGTMIQASIRAGEWREKVFENDLNTPRPAGLPAFVRFFHYWVIDCCPHSGDEADLVQPV
jgi:hypothetical protein